MELIARATNHKKITNRSPLAVAKAAHLLEVQSHAQAVILRVHTEIDFSSADVLEQTMKTAAAGNEMRIVVDLGACDYLDSSCLAVLVRQRRALGSRLWIVLPPAARTRRIFEVSGLLAALPIVGTVAEAMDGRMGIERNVL